MGRNTNVPFSTFISARLPSLALMASAKALGMRTARLLPHLQNSTIMLALPNVDTMYLLEHCGWQEANAWNPLFNRRPCVAASRPEAHWQEIKPERRDSSFPLFSS